VGGGEHTKSKFVRVLALFLMACPCAAQNTVQRKEYDPSKVDNQSLNHEKVALTRSKLSVLLHNLIVGDEAVARSLFPAKDQPGQLLLVDWEVYKNAPDLVDPKEGRYQPSNKMKITSTRSFRGLDPVGALDFSPRSLLVVCVDSKGELLYFQEHYDSRIVTGPPLYPDATEADYKAHAMVWYRAKTTEWVRVPEDARIAELQFYHAEWEGKEYRLELQAKVSLKR
jgi:hypothetical protein